MNLIPSAAELESILGHNVKSLRLQRNLDRETVCHRAGISQNALRNLEGGKGSTIKTLVRVLKTLGRENWLSSLAPEISINPLHMVKHKGLRQRASKRKLATKIDE